MYRCTLCAVFFLSAWSLVAWEAARVLIVSAPLARADAIVVLSGARVFKERAQVAAELYKQGRASVIILTNDNQQTGWSPKDQRNPSYYEYAVEELRRQGVPAERIEVLAQPVYSTYEEAVLLRGYAESRGWHSLLVVTSAYHSRRALWTWRLVFEGTGSTIGLEPVPPGTQTPSPASWWLHRRGWRNVPVEYLKLVYYWLQFR